METVRSGEVTQSTSTGGLEALKHYLTNYRAWLPEFALYGSIGFLIGFLLKNFGRTIVSVTAVILITLFVLQYTGMMITPISEMIGLPTVTSVQGGFELVTTWIKAHTAGVIGLLLGLFVGWRVG